MSPCSLIFFTCCPVLASQARTVRSGEQETRFRPSGVQCSSRIPFLCPIQCGVFEKGHDPWARGLQRRSGAPTTCPSLSPPPPTFPAAARHPTFYLQEVLALPVGAVQEDGLVVAPSGQDITVRVELQGEHLIRVACEQHGGRQKRRRAGWTLCIANGGVR